MTTKTASVNKDRKLILVSTTLILVAGSIFGGTFLMQWRLAHSQTIPAVRTLRLSAEDQDKVLTRAKWIRERWQPWAQVHKEELSRMLNASPDDSATLKQVYDQIPNTRELKQLGMSRREVTMGKYSFSWSCGFERLHYEDDPKIKNDPAALERHNKTLTYIRESVQSNFVKYHDVVLAISVNVGDTTISLWASGRITRERISPDSKAKYPNLEASEEELTPRFDFLN